LACILLLPWQTRWIISQGILANSFWEYGTLSLYVTDAVLVVMLIAFGFFLAKKKKKRLRRSSSIWLFLLVLWILVSSFWAPSFQVSFAHALLFIEGVLLFFMISLVPMNQRHLFWAWVIGGLIQAMFAVLQFLTQFSPESTLLGLAPHAPWQLGDSVIEISSGRFLRAYGSFPHPNILGGFLIVSLMSVIGLLKERPLLWQRMLLWISVPIMIAGLFFTFSRSAWLGFLVALSFFFVLEGGIQIRKQKRFFILLIFSMAVSVFSLSWIFSEIFSVRFQGHARLEQMSLEERLQSYHDAEVLFSQHPVTGIGIGSFTQAIFQLDPSREAWQYQPVHMVWVLLLVETGVIGVVLFLNFLFSKLKEIASGEIKSNVTFLSVLFGLGAISFLDHYLWSLHVGVLLFWLVLGLSLRSGEHGQ